jgi:hypothetical protein
MDQSKTFNLCEDGLRELIVRLGKPSDQDGLRLLIRAEDLLRECTSWGPEPLSDIRLAAVNQLVDISRAVNEYLTKDPVKDA